MIYLAAGVLLLFLLSAAGRRSRQRQMRDSLRRNFLVEARRSLTVYVPKLASAITDAELLRAFDQIYAEHLRRFGARDLADLLRKGQSEAAVSTSSDICSEAGRRLCSRYPQEDCDPELAGIALSDALTLAGPDMYAEMTPGG